MRVLVKFVDKYGFCGREYHPTSLDIGKTGTVIGSYTEVLTLEGVPYSTRNQGEWEAVARCLLEDPNCGATFYICRMDEGGILELGSFEVDVI